MTTTPPEAPTEPDPSSQGPRVTREEVKELGRIRRTIGQERKVAGVAGGLARHFDIDPIILRVAFVVLTLFGGAGVIAYVACWVLLPEDQSAQRPLGLDERNRGYALIGVGILAAVITLGGTLGNLFPWPLALVGVAVFLVLALFDRERNRPTAPAVPHVVDPATGNVVPAAPPGTPYSPASGGMPPTAPPQRHAGAPGASIPPVTAPYAPSGAPYAAPLTTGQPAGPVTAPVYPPPVYPAGPRLPRNPRKRGPILFWFTMALAALGVGLLGFLDLAGAPIPDPAYPALVVGVCGVMLLVGAFYGRAGGLIMVGLIAAVALIGATVTQEFDGVSIDRRPLSSVSVPTELRASTGAVILDLREVSDLAGLDGKHVELDVRMGRIEVIVPRGVSVSVDASIEGPGHIVLFGDERGGIDIADTTYYDAGPGTPELHLEANVGIGEIKVREGGF